MSNHTLRMVSRVLCASDRLWERFWEPRGPSGLGDNNVLPSLISYLHFQFQDDAEAVNHSLKKMNSDLDTKYSKFNKDSPGVVSDLLLQLEVRSSGLVMLARPKGQAKHHNLPSR